MIKKYEDIKHVTIPEMKGGTGESHAIANASETDNLELFALVIGIA